MSQYKITVEFTRERSNDEEVIAAKPQLAAMKFKDAAVQQLCEELQEAYDKLWMGGSFKITKIELPEEN